MPEYRQHTKRSRKLSSSAEDGGGGFIHLSGGGGFIHLEEDLFIVWRRRIYSLGGGFIHLSGGGRFIHLEEDLFICLAGEDLFI
jgi:hypothetical protein